MFIFNGGAEPPVEPPCSGIYCEQCGKEISKHENMWNLADPKTGNYQAVCWECVRDHIIEEDLSEPMFEITARMLNYEMIERPDSSCFHID